MEGLNAGFKLMQRANLLVHPRAGVIFEERVVLVQTGGGARGGAEFEIDIVEILVSQGVPCRLRIVRGASARSIHAHRRPRMRRRDELHDKQRSASNDNHAHSISYSISHSRLSPGSYTLPPRTSARNSSRVCLFSRNTPSMALDTAVEFCFSTPRITMHRCRASTITPTPCGLSISSMDSAIWLVSRSCICSRRAYMFTRRATLLSPTTFLSGM